LLRCAGVAIFRPLDPHEEGRGMNSNDEKVEYETPAVLDPTTF
jgi:hypothetical protein